MIERLLDFLDGDELVFLLVISVLLPCSNDEAVGAFAREVDDFILLVDVKPDPVHDQVFLEAGLFLVVLPIKLVNGSNGRLVLLILLVTIFGVRQFNGNLHHDPRSLFHPNCILLLFKVHGDIAEGFVVVWIAFHFVAYW